MSDINGVVKEIMDTVPTEQLRVDAQAHLRCKIFNIVLKHTAQSKEKLLSEIAEVDRLLYIANKKIEDEKVDSAGFNK